PPRRLHSFPPRRSSDLRLVDPDRRQGLGSLAVRHRLPDVDVIDAGDCDDVARERALHLDPFQPPPAVEARQLARYLRAVEPAERSEEHTSELQSLAYLV